MNYDKFINKTVSQIPPSGIRKFFDLVSDMDDAISLGVGEPDFITPWTYRDYAIKSIISGKTGYTANRGSPKLIEEISLYLNNRFNLDYSEKEIIVTVGASEAIDLALRTLITPGDGVIVPDPSYVSYMPNVALCGGVVQPARLDKNGFKLTKEVLEKAITPISKYLILPYPNNPTGAVLSRAELEELVPVIKKHDLFVISDEIYAELTYGARHTSIASLDGMKERTVTLNGFSKAFAMTGWRLGYLCAPLEVANAALKIHQYVIMCAPTASQEAAYCALRDGRENDYARVEEMRDEYDRRRKLTVAMLNDMGLDCFTPCGAFYAFADVTRFCKDDEAFAASLLNSQHVVVVPGTAFGGGGKGHVRCTYASSVKMLNRAFERMREFLRDFGKEDKIKS